MGRIPSGYCKRKIPVIDFHFQEQISMTKTRRTRQQWQQLINGQPDSGLTVHDYCQQQHLNVS
ncbi:MAG: hypothetical protein ACJA13_003752, partial [Paraglaciecola sp.]